MRAKGEEFQKRTAPRPVIPDCNIGRRNRMARDYVEDRDGGYYVADSRVSLDSIVHGFLRGHSAEWIAESFPQ